jgi:hypothetical protein
MSGEEAAQTGAEVAAAPATPAPQSSQPTGEQETQQQEGLPRDENGKFIPRERFNEVYGKHKQAERENAYLRQQLAQFQQQPQQPAQQQAQNIPDPGEYDWDLQKWGSTLSEQVAKTAYEQARQQFEQQQRYQYEQQILQQFESREAEYAQANPTYYDNVAALQQAIGFDPHIGEALALSDHGPAVLDYLAQHLDEADRISRLPAHLAAVQLGRIEAKVSSPKPKPVTQAPMPPPALGGGSQPNELSDKTTIDEWMAKRNAKRKG